MKIKPTNDRVLVTVIMSEQKTAGGIIMSGAPVETSKAKVEAVGPEVKNIKVGNTIALSKRCGMEIELDKKQYIILKEHDVLAVIE